MAAPIKIVPIPTREKPCAQPLPAIPDVPGERGHDKPEIPRPEAPDHGAAGGAGLRPPGGLSGPDGGEIGRAHV